MTYPILGDEKIINQTAAGGVPVRIVRRGAKGEQFWQIEGDILLPAKNVFRHLRDARAYLRGLTSAKGKGRDCGGSKFAEQSRRNIAHRLIHEIAERDSLTHAQIAGSLGVSATTVDSWLRPADNAAHRTPPAIAIKLLEQILARK